MGRLKEVPLGGTKHTLGHLKHVRNRAAQLGARTSKEIPFGGTEPTLGFLLDVLKQTGLCLLGVIPKQWKIIN